MEKLSAWAAPLLPYKLYIGLALVIILVLIYWFYFRDEKFDTAPTKGGKKKCKKCKKKPCKCKKASAKKAKKDADPDTEAEEDDDDDADDSKAQELYNIAHENLANDMGQDEFMQLAGNMGSPIIYIHLKQLYTVARDDGKDPAKTVTVEDYERVLKDS